MMQDTYRYHGHSISDPGSTYRTRDEIQGIRRARDPIDHVRTLLIEHEFADAGELKRLEKELKQVCSQSFCCSARARMVLLGLAVRVVPTLTCPYRFEGPC